MLETGNTRWCDGCGAEIRLAAVKQKEKIFCCSDCSKGVECDCADRMELDDDRAQKPALHGN